MTRKKAIGSINVELIRGKDIRPGLEEHFGELIYVTTDETYQEKKLIFNVTIFDDDTTDLSNGIYYIIDVWSSVFLSGAELNEFHKKYGNNPTVAQKKKLKIPIVLGKLEIRNGAILFGESENPKEKIEISAAILVDHQCREEVNQ